MRTAIIVFGLVFLSACNSVEKDEYVFRLMDENNDKNIDETEWKKAYSTMDQDKNGVLSIPEYQEFKNFPCKCGHK